MPDQTVKYTINLNIEEIRLPPFQDILILGKNAAHGKIGLSRSLELLIPNEFETVEVNEGNIEAVFIGRKIIRKISVDKILSVLRAKVFGLVSEGELLKVEFKVNISLSTINMEESI